MYLSHVARLEGVNIWFRGRTLEVLITVPDGPLPDEVAPALANQLNGLFLPPHLSHAGTRFLRSLPSMTGWCSLACELAGELQKLTSDFEGARQIQPTAEQHIWRMALQCLDFDFAEACVQSAVHACRRLHAGLDIQLVTHYDQLLALADEVFPEIITAPILAAAQRRGIPVIRQFEVRMIQLGEGVHQRRICSDNGLSTSRTMYTSAVIANNKDHVKQLFASVGIPVPAGAVVTTEDDAAREAQQLGWPVVVKPLDAQCSLGVSVDLTNPEQVRQAFQRARAKSNREDVIVEMQLVGSLHRLLVVDGSLVAAVRREPASVVGDSQHTVRELVELANQDVRRGLDSRWPCHRIPLNADLLAFLRESGRTPETVPGLGEEVPLGWKVSTDLGSSTWDVTAQVHPETRELAIEAACLVGLDVAGIDIIATDIGRPLESQGGGFLEINELPGIFLHAPPFSDPPRPVGDAIVQQLFPDPSHDGRIPLIVALGRQSADQVARQTADLLRSDGRYALASCPDGTTWSNRRRSQTGASLPNRLRTLLLHPRTEAAVVSAPATELLQTGLGADRCAVLVLVEGPDPNNGDADRLAMLIRQLIASAEHCVVNLDDPFACAHGELAGPSALRFSSSPDHPQLTSHLAAGHPGAYLQDQEVVIRNAADEFVYPIASDSPASPRDLGLAVVAWFALNCEHAFATPEKAAAFL